MSYCIEIIPYARLHMRPVQIHLLKLWKPVSQNLKFKVPITTHLKCHLKWWLNLAYITKGRSLKNCHHASTSVGWGGDMGTQIAHRTWNISKKKTSYQLFRNGTSEKNNKTLLIPAEREECTNTFRQLNSGTIHQSSRRDQVSNSLSKILGTMEFGNRSSDSIESSPHCRQNTRQLLSASWRAGTQKDYSGKFKKFCSWCNEREIDPYTATLTEVADFLTCLFTSGLQYRTIAGYRSMLSTVLPPIENIPTLLSDLQALRIGAGNISVHSTGVFFIREGLSKQDRPGHIGSKIFVPCFKDNKLLNRKRSLRYYLKMIDDFRNCDRSDSKLFLIVNSSHSPVSSKTLSNWIVQTIQLAYNDKKKSVKAYSTSVNGPS
ncbi:unnamed protein product [Mytilus coruscus]|uniref:Core-binding (CB) domain-containing protein n=1 Tax=Mytilus coruscus TaxID=42192 RepID=A0A6J8C7X6_MYTCO|nr:unnamed protein product [Mytilus coruscus]